MTRGRKQGKIPFGGTSSRTPMLPFMNVRTTVLVRTVILQFEPSYVHVLYVRILWNFLIRPWPVFYVLYVRRYDVWFTGRGDTPKRT